MTTPDHKIVFLDALKNTDITHKIKFYSLFQKNRIGQKQPDAKSNSKRNRLKQTYSYACLHLFHHIQ